MTMWAAGAAVVATTAYSAYTNSQAAGKAADAYSQAADKGLAYNSQMYQDILKQNQGYQTLGNNAATQYGNYINNGYFTNQPTMNDLTTLMPNYEFGLKQGIGQFNAGLNAGGGAVSGNAIQGGQQFAQDYAGNALQNAFSNYQTNRQNVASNLGAGIGYGLNANQTVANAGVGAASNSSNLLSSIGNAQASGIMGQAAAQTNSANTLGSYAMLYGLKKG